MWQEEAFYTEKELAAMFKLSVGTLRRWRQKGEGPPHVKCLYARKGTVRYPVELLREWLRVRIRPTQR